MKISDHVEHILANNIDARSDDKELLIEYMQRSGMRLSEHQIEVMQGMPSFETIRRVRQKLQEDGKYPATDSVKANRNFKSMQVQQVAPSFSAQNLGEVLNDGRQVLPWGV